MADLTNGALYAVRWNVVPGQAVGIARWYSDRLDPHRDLDEEPREWWEFFANDLTGEPSEYDVLCRLMVTPALIRMSPELTELIALSNVVVDQ